MGDGVTGNYGFRLLLIALTPASRLPSSLPSRRLAVSPSPNTHHHERSE
jgi:hypothetical protein